MDIVKIIKIDELKGVKIMEVVVKMEFGYDNMELK